MPAQLSDHFANRKPSAIRQAQILFAKRPGKEQITCVNLAIGNISLPMHPAMRERMDNLNAQGSPFAEGVVKYTASVGTDEAQQAFLNIIASCGADTSQLACLVTDGGSQSMELMVLGLCGPRSARPLMLLDPAYTNYMDMARRCAVGTVSIRRELRADGTFAPFDFEQMSAVIREHKPAALVIIPADNPTGQFLNQAKIVEIAKLCVEHDIWLVSDEAYRGLQYGGEAISSVWLVSEEEVPGISGRRLSIESSSKMFNACGLRVGGLVTDHAELHAKAVAEYTANLSSNAIGQYIFGAIAHQSHAALHAWYGQQQAYYSKMMREVAEGLRAELPGIIVSNPDASLYSVLDVRDVAPASFDAAAFVAFCATEGSVDMEGTPHTLLVSPMAGFYGEKRDNDPSSKQMRLAFVAPPAEMSKVPKLFPALLRAYLER